MRVTGTLESNKVSIRIKFDWDCFQVKDTHGWSNWVDELNDKNYFWGINMVHLGSFIYLFFSSL